MLSLKFLGGFAAALNHTPLDKFRSNRARALVAYLACQPDQAHPRDLLATLLWGDYGTSTAKTNLRVVLSSLGKLLDGHAALEVTRRTVTFHCQHAHVDSVAFVYGVSQVLALGPEAQVQKLPALEGLLGEYRGEFLAGFSVDDAPEFGEWRAVQQEKLHQLAMQGLELLQTLHLAQANYQQVTTFAQQQIGLEPWHESAHRRLMQIHALQGNPGAALHQFDTLCAILEKELDVTPDAATFGLLAQIQANAHAQVDKPDSDSAAPASAKQSQPKRTNLPNQLTSFVGREADVTGVVDALRQHRLVTILGMGGVGKTRVAAAVANQILTQSSSEPQDVQDSAENVPLLHFDHGVWFVPMAAVQSASSIDALALAVASALKINLTGTNALIDQLVAYLRAKDLLLVLDNLEQIADGIAGLLLPLLEETNVACLVTSRVRLNLPGERVIPLAGLPREDAIALFTERGQQAEPTIKLSKSLSEIERICTLVEGLPLGIELAAAWVEHFSIQEIAASIADNLDFLASRTASSNTSRHSSLRAVYLHSLNLLSAQEQNALARLSVFYGGFGRKAAIAVAQTNPHELAALLDKSLIRRVEAGRYDMHEVVRGFAVETLRDFSDEAAWAQTQDAHSHYFLSLLGDSTVQKEWTKLTADLENIRKGWTRSVDEVNWPLLVTSAGAFGDYLYHHGLLRDGKKLVQSAVERLEQSEELAQVDRNGYLVQLLLAARVFVKHLDGAVASVELAQRALDLTTDTRVQIQLHGMIGRDLAETSEWSAAADHYQMQEAIARQSGDEILLAQALCEQAANQALYNAGDYQEMIQQLEEAYRIVEQSEEVLPDLLGKILHGLSTAHLRYGDYAKSKDYALRHAAVAQESNRRVSEIDSMLAAGLACDFSGAYPDALAYYQQALSIAQEIDDREGIGLLSANLMIVNKHMGEYEQAVRYGKEAIPILDKLETWRMAGLARNRLGHTFVALERWDEALAVYTEALDLWATLNNPNRIEAEAGIALAKLKQGDPNDALARVNEVLAAVEQEGLGNLVEPIQMLLHCVEVLQATNQPEQANRLIEQGQQWVTERSALISDDYLRSCFEKNVLAHRAILVQ